MFVIWGLRVIYRTLGRGVFFCRRCGGDREYRHRTDRRYVTVFFLPLLPLAKTGAHVQCLTCKTRYVTEALKLPTTAAMELALTADLAEPAEAGRLKIAALGRQLQVQAREWYLAEAVRIAMADAPLTTGERAAVGQIAACLGMTKAQAIGVVMLTEQGAGQN